MAADTTPTTLLEAIRYYSDLDVCQAELVAARWPDGVRVPDCGSYGRHLPHDAASLAVPHTHPRRQFSVKVGTIFEDSPIGLDKWFVAIWMIAGAKNGISSLRDSPALGVTQKTAWFMLHRIRLAMQTQSVREDERRSRNRRDVRRREVREHAQGAQAKRLGMSQANSMVGKVAVMGLLERHGEGSEPVRTRIVEGAQRCSCTASSGRTSRSSRTSTPTRCLSYQHDQPDRPSLRVDHTERYVDGAVHTNGLENFWSLLKRAINGTYVQVEPFHLFRYVDEQAFRFNTRKGTDSDRFRGVLAAVTGRRVMYKDLIAKALPA